MLLVGAVGLAGAPVGAATWPSLAGAIVGARGGVGAAQGGGLEVVLVGCQRGLLVLVLVRVLQIAHRVRRVLVGARRGPEEGRLLADQRRGRVFVWRWRGGRGNARRRRRRRGLAPAHLLRMRQSGSEHFTLVLVAAGRVIDQSKLEQGAKHEGQTDTCPDIDRLGVGDRRQRGIDAGDLRGHREQRRDAQRDARRNGVGIEPKRDP